MPSGTATTSTKARRFVQVSKRSRPATSGNKNLNSRARRKGSQTDSRLTQPLKGPDRGEG